MLFSSFLFISIFSHQIKSALSFVPSSEVDALEAIWLSADGLFWDWQEPSDAGAVWHFEAPAGTSINPCSDGGIPWQAVVCSPQDIDCSLDTVECHIAIIDLMYYGLSGKFSNSSRVNIL
jgi:hypothetical protein